MTVRASAFAVLALLASLPAAAQSTFPATRLGTFATGLYDQGAAEIAAYDAATRRLFFIKAAANEVVALDASNPSAPVVAFTLSLAAYGASASSVATRGGLVAVAVEAAVKTDPGTVALFRTDGTFVAAVPVGALPDALAFSPDGQTIVVANEGEPNTAYTVDPEGSISIIRLGAGAPVVQTVGFRDFNVGGPRAAEITRDVRIFGPGASVAQDLEPEFPAISPDGLTAYVSLQENNALAIVTLATGAVTVRALGYKNHALAGQGLDASDQDNAINITTWPIYGMYQPDGVAAYAIGGQTYVFTANEGDAREYTPLNEAVRVGTRMLDPTVRPDGDALKAVTRLGRLNVTSTRGDVDGDGDYEGLFAFGARSFSVHNAAGVRLWDSGDDIERRIAALVADGTLPPAAFNTNSTANGADARSDDKGPEPEGVVVGEVGGVPYAFVGLERLGGVIVYNVSVPTAPTYAGLIINRNFAGSPSGGTAGDLAPEGLVFIAAADSPTGQPLLVTSNEVSGTVTFYRLGATTAAAPAPDAAPTEALRLAGTVPNPGRAPSVRFALAVPAEVALVLFDALGREVGRAEAAFAAGADLRLDAPVTGLPAGVYHYRLDAATGTGAPARATGRFVLTP